MIGFLLTAFGRSFFTLAVAFVFEVVAISMDSPFQRFWRVIEDSHVGQYKVPNTYARFG